MLVMYGDFFKKKEDIINLQVCALLSTLSMLCSSPTQGFVFPTPFLLCCKFFTQQLLTRDIPVQNKVWIFDNILLTQNKSHFLKWACLKKPYHCTAFHTYNICGISYFWCHYTSLAMLSSFPTTYTLWQLIITIIAVIVWTLELVAVRAAAKQLWCYETV